MRVFMCVCACMRARTLSHSAHSLSPVRHFCSPMDCSLPGSSVYGIFQARILNWVAISSSRGSFQPSDSLPLSHPWCVGVGGIEKSESVWGLRF